MVLKCREFSFLHRLCRFHEELFLILGMSFFYSLREVSPIRGHFINSAHHLPNYIQKAIQMTSVYCPDSKD